VQPRTKRQKEVLDYIVRFVERNGYGPSYQRIAHQLGVSSKGGVQRHIIALENQGLIARKRENGSFRIELCFKNVGLDSICVVEAIEPAQPGNGGPSYTRSVTTMPKNFIGSLMPDEVLVYKAIDDSMSARHIEEGDIVLLEKRSYARRGEVSLVLTKNDEMILGLYYQMGGETEIRPANSDLEPQLFPADEVVVQGVMRGLVRPIPSHED
jgi:repressor LexA